MDSKKRALIVVFSIVFFGILGVLVSSKVFSPSGLAVVSGEFCGDGTQYNSCSVSKPYFCQNGELVSSCNTCGCPYGYRCDTNTGLCEGANSCALGGGACKNSCAQDEIEFLPLTSTCNIQENRDGKISLVGTKSLFIEVTLKNLNEAVTLSDISVNAYIVGTDIKDGFSLLSLDPGVDFKQTISLDIPDSLDLSKEYSLIIDIAFKDKKISAQYTSQFVSGGYVFVAKDASISQGRLVPVGQDLAAGVEIVNTKCCVKNTNLVKSSRFIDYCSTYNICSASSKPLYCQQGLLVENCGACGCPDGYSCTELGVCVNQISSQEIDRFYLQTQIKDEETPFVSYTVKEFSRLAKEVEEPKVSVALNVVSVDIADVSLNVTRENITQKPKISIDIKGL